MPSVNLTQVTQQSAQGPNNSTYRGHGGRGRECGSLNSFQCQVSLFSYCSIPYK